MLEYATIDNGPLLGMLVLQPETKVGGHKASPESVSVLMSTPQRFGLLFQARNRAPDLLLAPC